MRKWKADAIGIGDMSGFGNRPYENFGCSTQSILAAQIADPSDLSRPRPMAEGDIGKRTDDVKQLREDGDPTTKWSNDAATVGQ